MDIFFKQLNDFNVAIIGLSTIKW